MLMKHHGTLSLTLLLSPGATQRFDRSSWHSEELYSRYSDVHGEVTVKATAMRVRTGGAQDALLPLAYPALSTENFTTAAATQCLVAEAGIVKGGAECPDLSPSLLPTLQSYS